MTPDMKRLCQAAKEAIMNREGYCNDRDAEEVVRAVLMALREPSEDVAVEGGVATAGMDVGDEGCEAIGRTAITAMIDHILADPAKA